MTLAALRALVAKKIDEDTSATNRYITDATIDRAINRAMSVFSFLTLCYETSATLTFTVGDPSLELLATVPTFIAPLRVSQDGVHLQPKSLHRFAAQKTSWTGANGPPTAYCMVAANLMAVSPPPSTDYEDVTLYYAAFAPALTTGTDVPAIPAEDHERLAAGAATIIRQVILGGQHGEEAMQDMQDYWQGIQRRAEHVRQRNQKARFDTLPPGIAKKQLEQFLKAIKL